MQNQTVSNTLVDITNWENDVFTNYGGCSRKTGKISPSGDHYMVKFEKKHTFKCSHLHLFQQYLNSEIIRLLGFSAQETFLATCDNDPVLCCKNFVPTGSKLVTMDVFLRTLYNSYELTEITDLEQFERVLQENEILKPYKKSLKQSFWNMVVLDVFLMNLGRTTSDFGYLVSEHNVVQSPLFDNRTTFRASTVPLISDMEPVLQVDLLFTDKFKDFHDAVAHILPVIERKMPAIHDFIYKQDRLSESQKEMKYDLLCETLHKLQLSYKLQQVATTMEIENMNLTEQAYDNLQAIATGQKTVDEIIEEIKKRYS